MFDKSVMVLKSDPVWDRLYRQASWGRLLHDLSVEQRISVDCRRSNIGGHYHCQLHRDEPGKTGYHRHFMCEGYGDHPLGAIRVALTRLAEPIKPVIRSKLLEALIDFLQEEIEGRCAEARG